MLLINTTLLYRKYLKCLKKKTFKTNLHQRLPLTPHPETNL